MNIRIRPHRIVIALILALAIVTNSFYMPLAHAVTTNTQQCSDASGAGSDCVNCHIPDPNNKGACLDYYYTNNAITMYDPNDKPCEPQATASTASSSNTLTGNDRAEQIYRFLVANGLTPEQAAGVMGNLFAESGLDPAMEEGGRIVDANYVPIPHTGFGLAQWTDPGRQINLIAYQKSSGKTIIDLSMQLEFLWKEMSSSAVLPVLKTATTPEEAAYLFHRDYEISRDTPEQVAATRGGNARKYYEQFKGLAVSKSSAFTANTISATNACSHTEGVLNGGNMSTPAVSPMSDSFTIFNQCQWPPYGGPWGTQTSYQGRTVCMDGCLPTALAMIAKNIAGQNVTPQETVNYFTGQSYWANDGGSLIDSAYKAADHYGLRSEQIDKNNLAAYQDVFKNGGVIIAISTGSSPFMPQRHAIILRGMSDADHFLIADPGQRDTNTPPANQPRVTQIMTDIRSDGASAAYAFYKK